MIPADGKTLKCLWATGWIVSVLAAIWLGRQMGSDSWDDSDSSSDSFVETAPNAVSGESVDEGSSRRAGVVPRVAPTAEDLLVRRPTFDFGPGFGPDRLFVLQQFMEDANLDELDIYVERILGGLAPEDYPDLFDFLRDWPRNAVREAMVRETLTRWSRTDPLVALAALDGWPEAQDRAGCEALILAEALRKDPRALVDLLNVRGAPGEWETFLDSIFEEGRAVDSLRVWELLSRAELDANQRESLFAKWSRSPDFSAEWVHLALSQVSAEERLGLLKSVGSWVRGSPVTELSEFVAFDLFNHYTAPEEQATLLRELGREWVSRDVEGALAFVDGMDPMVREKSLAGLVMDWAKTDAEAAGQYLARFPDGPLRNQLLGKLALDAPWSMSRMRTDSLRSLRDAQPPGFLREILDVQTAEAAVGDFALPTGDNPLNMKYFDEGLRDVELVEDAATRINLKKGLYLHLALSVPEDQFSMRIQSDPEVTEETRDWISKMVEELHKSRDRQTGG